MWIINRDLRDNTMVDSMSFRSDGYKKSESGYEVPYVFRLVAPDGTHHYQGYNTEKNDEPLIVRSGYYRIFYKHRDNWVLYE